MSEFFGRLDTELRAAAGRRPRRRVPVPAVAAACVLALAAAPIVLALGNGGGDAAPDRGPAGEPPRGDLVPSGGTVVASGVEPAPRPWLVETYEKDGERCLRLLVAAAGWDPREFCPYAGGAEPPPFGALTVRIVGERATYGPVPDGATAVELVHDGQVVESVKTHHGPEGVPGSFFLIAIPPGLEGDAELRWLGEDGQPGGAIGIPGL